MRRNNFIKAIILFIACAWLSTPLSGVKAAGASLYLAPGSGTYVIGGTFSVSVKVNSGGTEINAAEGSLNYDTAFLEAVSVSKGGSVFPFWTTEPGINKSAGTVSFGGGMPPPAYNGSAGHICAITFKAKKAGNASIRFSGGAVLANDGKGTNVLEGLVGGTYTISPKAETPPPSTDRQQTPPAREPEPDYNLPKIESKSHPDQNKWYNNDKVEFSWELPEGVSGVSIAFNEDPAGDPGPASDGLFSQKTFEGVSSGVYYLHLKFKDARRWGTIAHYRIMVDVLPPQPFEPEIREISIGEWPEILFSAEDKESGLEGYEIYIGSLEKQSHELEADQKSFKVSDLSVGGHTAIIKALDKAGNERMATIHFTINPIDAPAILNYAREIKSSDQFFINGTAMPDVDVKLYIEGVSGEIVEGDCRSDVSGNWFYVREEPLANGRYSVWAVAENKNGIKSNPSQTAGFLVSPPVFAVIGSVVIDYFTVITSLLFMVLLIIFTIFYIVAFIRKRLKKEAVEVEEVLLKNAENIKQAIDREFLGLNKYEGKTGYKKEKEQAKERLKNQIDDNVRKSLKEVKDVEDILR